MSQKNRTKEIWLIPKRVNLHQTICLIDGIIERNYDGTSWNPQKQNNLGVNLKNWGATKDGKNISPQAIRTLVASIPQYLGFLYINSEKTPNTICLTEAGKKLWAKHKDELVKIPNIKEGKCSLITKSDIVLKQMEKLQITNPIINKDCEKIYVFPFRFMLKVLLKVGYLDQEEIAYFLFKVRGEDEVDLIVREIENFRSLSKESRASLIDAFRLTHIGNITLVKAPSAGYFMSLCQITGIIDKIHIKPTNKADSITAIQINNTYLDYVNEVLNKKYFNIEPYNFEDNLQLWIDYIGEPSRDYPPINVSLINKVNSDFLIQIYKDGFCKYIDLIAENDVLTYPMFMDEKYCAKIIDIDNGNEIGTLDILPSFNNRKYEIQSNFSNTKKSKEDIDDIVTEIIEHCKSRDFAGKTLNYIQILIKTIGIDNLNYKSLRGAYLEYYFFKMLNLLKDEKIIDEVIWNGKVGKYGLPTQAPGGKLGISDIIFVIDNLHIVLELTTIKPKAMQFSAEGSSVPDHIRLYKEENKGRDVLGIFSAPIIHARNTQIMESAADHYGVKLHCTTIDDLVEVLKTKGRDDIKKYFTDKL